MELMWFATILIASTMYGFLSPLIYARRLLYLSSASAHIALLAVVLAIPISKIALNSYFWAVMISLALMYAIGYTIHRGVDADTATAVFVAFTASLSVIAMYIVLTRYPIEADLMGLILGDPLLATLKDVVYLLVVSAITVTSVVLTYREQVYIGLERDCAVISGINVKLYDFVFYTVLGISTVAMIKVVGFVLQHVLILLPSAIAVAIAKNSKGVVLTSVVISVVAGVVGLYLAIITNQAPSGVIGLIMFLIYAFVKIKGGRV
jgi:ABC-type Mn2+/Zn2+ transport system permease subunit